MLIKFKLQNIFAFGKSGSPKLGNLEVKSADSKGDECKNESNDMYTKDVDKVHESVNRKNVEKSKKIESIRKWHQRHLLEGAVKTDIPSLKPKVEKDYILGCGNIQSMIEKWENRKIVPKLW